MADQPVGHTPSNPPAFPLDLGSGDYHEGMELRDYFAAKALPLAWQAFDDPMAIDYHHVAREAYELADAMLKAREVC